MTLSFTRNGCRKLSNYGKMCRNIQAWVNAVALTPASCPTGVCAHGKSISGPGVKSLLIVHKVRVCRMFEITLRDL